MKKNNTKKRLFCPTIFYDEQGAKVDVSAMKKNKEIFLPLDIYEKLIKKAQKYETLQKEKGIAWVKVKVNAPVVRKKKKKTA